MSRKRIGKNKNVALTILPPDAAGVDIGATGIYVVVLPDRDPEPERNVCHLHSGFERARGLVVEMRLKSS